jgi:D-alanyl-D-alanine endopeptidase (penicillin-binding protein 7)
MDMEFAVKISSFLSYISHCSYAGRPGGFVRLIRPLHVTRVCTLVLAVGIGAAAAPVEAAGPATKKAATTKQSSTRQAATASSASKPTYNAQASSARKARLERARLAARAREQSRLKALRALQAAMTPRYKTDADGSIVPDIRAAAAIIFNPETGKVLWQENAQDKRSIASITKVMTTLVFLEDNPDLSREVTVDRSDVFAASTTYLRANERITLDNLLHLTLIASDNAAARALARLSHGGTASFIERMNEKALELGLESTSFVDPSGLNPDNVSSAYDLSRLITFAASDERIAPIMRTPEYQVSTSRRTFNIYSTNRLVRGGEVEVMGGKTGFISKAGYCLATLLRLPQSNHNVAVVVLGATSNNGRFWETRHLFNWLSDKASDIFSKEDAPQ